MLGALSWSLRVTFRSFFFLDSALLWNWTGPAAQVLRAWLSIGGKKPEDKWLNFTRIEVFSPSFTPVLLITKQCLVSFVWWGPTSICYLLCSSLFLTTSPYIRGDPAYGLLVHNKRDIGNRQPTSVLSRSGIEHFPVPMLTHATTSEPAPGASNPRERGAPESDCMLNFGIYEITAFFSLCRRMCDVLASGRVTCSETEITWNLLLKKPSFVHLFKNCDWIGNSCNPTGKCNFQSENLAYQHWEQVQMSYRPVSSRGQNWTSSLFWEDEVSEFPQTKNKFAYYLFKKQWLS